MMMVVDLAQCSPQKHPKKEGRGDLSSISCLISAKSGAFSSPSSFLNPMGSATYCLIQFPSCELCLVPAPSPQTHPSSSSLQIPLYPWSSEKTFTLFLETLLHPVGEVQLLEPHCRPIEQETRSRGQKSVF